MIAQLRALPLEALTPGAFPGGKVFSCPMEGGVNIEAGHSIQALNINFQMQLTPLAAISTNARGEALREGHEALLAAVALAEGAKNNAIKAYEQAFAVRETAEKEYIKGPTLALFYTYHEAAEREWAAATAVKQEEAQIKAYTQQAKLVEVEIEELGQQEARELLRQFTTPLNITARLVKGVEKEIVWVGTLEAKLLPLGNQKVRETGLPEDGVGPGWTFTEYPNAILAYESHIQLPPFTLHKAEPLELIITITGPPTWKVSEGAVLNSGVGLLPGAKVFSPPIKATIGSGLVTILASENSVNYEHEP